jgi:c(7)-type cytochrome triheme protein
MTLIKNFLYSLMVISVMVLGSLAHDAQSVPVGAALSYEGKGAGEVVFDGTLHAAKGLTCSDCHERQGLMPSIFEKKKNASFISMRKIEMGMSCGKCHPVSMNDMSSCSLCHHK